jgi:tRNA pseudouridine synthase 2
LPTCSRARIQESVKAGAIRVNGNVQVKPAFKLRPGDEVVCKIVERPPLNVEPEDIPLDVVYEDKSLLVINKPAGLVVHPAAGNPSGTLVNAVLHHCNLPGLLSTATTPNKQKQGEENLNESSSSSKDDDEEGEVVSGLAGATYSTDMMYGNVPVPRPGIVHRLDKGTSGLIVVAKDDVAKEKLQNQFKERSVERQYLSLLCGHLSPSSSSSAAAAAVPQDHAKNSNSTVNRTEQWGRVVTAIGRDKRERIRMASYPVEGVENKPHLKRAASNYHVKEVFMNGGASLVAWRLETGRTHQIRVHAKHLGSPLIGDDIYGGTPSPLTRTCVEHSSSTNTSSSSSLKADNTKRRAKVCSEAVAKAMHRPALHAATLGFEHPETGEKMRFQIDPPEDFNQALQVLRSFFFYSRVSNNLYIERE